METSSEAAKEPPKKDAWDKLSAVSSVIAAVLVPLVIALVGNWYSAALKDREATLSEATFKREWVQLGLSILRDPNTNDDARQWGTDIINFYSDVKMSHQVQESFVRQGAVLPPAPVAQTAPSAGTASTVGPTTPPQAPTASGNVPAPTATERVAILNRLQTQAAKALLDHDLPTAIEAYDKAYEIWPTFRTVDEIRTFLKKHPNPTNDQQWSAIYKKMREFDLRGVDSETLNQLKQRG